MGGRGASSGVSDSGKIYGTEYHTVFSSGNIKFIKGNAGSATAPMETMTKGRVYVTLGSDNQPRFVTYYDKNNHRFKQIDIAGRPHIINNIPTLPHTHKGYNHSEKGTFNLSPSEQKLVERIIRIWRYHTK